MVEKMMEMIGSMCNLQPANFWVVERGDGHNTGLYTVFFVYRTVQLQIVNAINVENMVRSINNVCDVIDRDIDDEMMR